MEITKGKWEVNKKKQNEVYCNGTIIVTVYGINTFEGYKYPEESFNSSILIADAGNTYQQTNKLPSELAEANKELLEALSKFKIAYVNHCNKPSTRLVIEMEGLIKKHSHA